MEIKFERVDWEFIKPFSISYQTRTHSETILVTLTDGPHIGRGEALGVSYHGETIGGMLAQIADVAKELRNGATRKTLSQLLPAGGARNALDCALWDIEAKRTGIRAWEAAGFSAVRSLKTAYTLGLDTPEKMGEAAAAALIYPLLKLKLTGEDDLQRVEAVRRARPDADLIVDANQAWTPDQLKRFAPALVPLGVKLIEQPLPAGQDDILADFTSPVPLCADESCQTAACLPALRGKYDYINIKLDKTGGLTEALHLARTATEEGFRLMVGCMAGTSISMAPAFVVGQYCDVVDLDGPLLTKGDVPHAIGYDGAVMPPPKRALWG